MPHTLIYDHVPECPTGPPLLCPVKAVFRHPSDLSTSKGLLDYRVGLTIQDTIELFRRELMLYAVTVRPGNFYHGYCTLPYRSKVNQSHILMSFARSPLACALNEPHAYSANGACPAFEGGRLHQCCPGLTWHPVQIVEWLLHPVRITCIVKI